MFSPHPRAGKQFSYREKRRRGERPLVPKFADISGAPVTVEVLADVLAMYAELPPGERVFDRRARRVLDLLAKRVHGPNSGPLAMTVMLRLMALDVLLEGPDIKDWTLPGAEAGTTFAHTDLLQVAAEAPIVEGWHRRPEFDGRHFRRRALRLAAATGRT